MSPYDGLPQAAFSSPSSRGSISSLRPYRGELGTSQPFRPGSAAQGPPDHFESLLLGERCAPFGFR